MKPDSRTYPIPQMSPAARPLGWLRWFSLLSVLASLFTNVRGDIIPEGCTFNGIFIALGVDKQQAHVGDTLSYSLVVGNAPFPSCRAEQITASITTPDGVVHPVTLTRTTLNPGESDPYNNVVTYVVRAQDVRANGIVVGAANLTAVVNQNVINENATTFKDVNTVVVNPCISITATCQGGTTSTGGRITYAGKVRNCGDVRLNGVMVVGVVNGVSVPVAGPFELAPGEEAPFEGSYPGDPCTQTTATITVSARDTLLIPKEVSASTTVTCGLTSAPKVTLTRTCPEVPALAGGSYNYTGTIQNTGDVALKNISVTSDRPASGTVVFTLAELAPGATANFSGSYATGADSCTTTDTLTVTAQDICARQTVTDSKSLTCPLRAAGQIDLTVTCPATPGTIGGIVVVNGSVRNPGTVTLQNIAVVNNQTPGVPVFTLASLAPGASANFTASLTAAAGACEVTATFAVSSADRCGGTGIGDVATVSCPVVGNPVIVVTHDCGVERPVAGGTGSFTGIVRNAGNVPLSGVTVVSGATTLFGPATLAAGESASFIGSFSVASEGCTVTTSVTASGTAACNNQAVTSTSTKSCPVATAPRLVLSKNCPQGVTAPGGQITYSGSVFNSGNVTLTDVSVNSGSSRVFGPITLTPGQSATFTANGSVGSNACSVTDTWNASGKDQCSGVVVTDTATTTCPVLGAPQLDLTLRCPSGSLTPGGTGKYSGTVSNRGNVTVNNIVVVNANSPSVPVFTAASLAAGASVNFNFDVSVPSGPCSLETSLTVSAVDACGGVGASDTASVSCPVSSSPAIAVTQDCPTGGAFAGSPSTFTGRVTNTGNVTLMDVVVVSKLAGSAPVFGPIRLAPGQSADYSGTYTVASNNDCEYDTQVTATGADECTGKVVSASNSIKCPSLSSSPGIEISFLCPSSPTPQGKQMKYRATIKNTGTGRMVDIEVYSSLNGGERVYHLNDMEPGEVNEFNFESEVPADCCTLSTTLRAIGYNECSEAQVTDTYTVTCPVLFKPEIKVTKVCPSDEVQVGDSITITGTVSNTGDVTLVDVNLVHQAGSEPFHILGPISLAPNQTVNYKATFIVPPGTCGESAIVATGHVLCNEEQTVTASATSKCKILTTPMIMVEKYCPTLPVSSGNVFTYSGRVINAGNVTLTDVTVVNSMPKSNTPVFGPVTLAPGASADFIGSYTLDEICCEAVDYLTAKGKDACTGKGVENTGSAVCEVFHVPRIEVTKQCFGLNSFSGIVKNTGDITLSNVVVRAESVLLGPIELAPGETASYSGTSSASDAFVEAIGIATCRAIQVIAQATCAGPTPHGELAINKPSVGSGKIGLSWQAVSGRFYRVETRTDASGALWEPVPGEVQATGPTAEKTDVPADGSTRFYRVIQLE